MIFCFIPLARDERLPGGWNGGGALALPLKINVPTLVFACVLVLKEYYQHNAYNIHDITYRRRAHALWVVVRRCRIIVMVHNFYRRQILPRRSAICAMRMRFPSRCCGGPFARGFHSTTRRAKCTSSDFVISIRTIERRTPSLQILRESKRIHSAKV